MGTTLSVTTGYGFAIPAEISQGYDEAHEDDEDYDGFYEHLCERILDSYPLLDSDMATYYDYTPDEDGSPAYAVFAKSTVVTNYGGGVFERETDPELGSATNDEENQLRALAKELGVPNDDYNSGLSYLTVVSLG
jgi:hypothetical protein